MPLTIRRLTNTSDAQRMTVRFPGDAFLFPLAPRGSTNLGDQSRDVPVLNVVQPSEDNSITIVVAMFPGLNWYLYADRHDNAWLSSDTSGPSRSRSTGTRTGGGSTSCSPSPRRI